MRRSSNADDAWKGMARAIPAAREGAGPTASEAGRVAYSALLEGTDRHRADSSVTGWLLLRSSTASRLGGR